MTKLYDAFETKEQAELSAEVYKSLGVGIVQVRRVNEGRLKWGVFLGGINSGMYV